MKRVLGLMLLSLFIWNVCLAQEFGAIKGEVVDQYSGEKLQGVNISIEGTSLGTITDKNGQFEIMGLAPKVYSVTARYIGYKELIIADIRVESGKTKFLTIKLEEAMLDGEVVVVEAERPRIEKNRTNSVRINEIQSASGSRSKSTAKPFGYSIEDKSAVSYNTEEYQRIQEDGFLEVADQPLSTFSADVDVASYANARRFLMQDQLPYPDAVRIEEFINYFSYDYPKPDGEHPINIYSEYADCPWDEEAKLVQIGINSRQINAESRKASNLVFC